MKKAFKITFAILLVLALFLALIWFIQGSDIPVMNPKGMIGLKERKILIISTLLMLIVVVPVFILALIVAWKYRADNTKARYSPDWDYNRTVEMIWWGIPCVIVAILTVITWIGCRDLDPFRPLQSDRKPITIQVVALQWKWLFIYPEYNIASLNWVQFPEKTPLNFEITSDAPMNSFWIPHLGGQIYAMPGMSTKLHLISDEVGHFRGSSANLSGRGFASMTFTAAASSEVDFQNWVRSARSSGRVLTPALYNELLAPSENDPVTYYIVEDKGFYDSLVMKYMMPEETSRN